MFVHPGNAGSTSASIIAASIVAAGAGITTNIETSGRSHHFWIEWIPHSRNPVPCPSWPALDATSALVRHAELL